MFRFPLQLLALAAILAMTSGTMNLRLRRNHLNLPDDGIPWVVRSDGVRFKRFSAKLNWWDAREVCMQHGGDLASFEDQADFNFIRFQVAKLGSGRSSYGDWIGGNDIEVEGTFVFTDGTPFEFQPWYPGQPDDFNGVEECVHMGYRYQGVINDLPCTTKLSFICESPARVTINPVSFALRKGDVKEVEIKLEQPITCPSEGPNPCDVQVFFTNVFPDDLLVEPCGLQFLSTDVSRTKLIQVTALDDFVFSGEQEYHVVTEPAESADPFYNEFNPNDIFINRQPPQVPRLCASTGDPHFTSFDGARYNYYGEGTVHFYNSLVWDLKIQTRMKTCFRGRSCNCGVAAREGPNFFEFDICNGQAPVPRVISRVRNADAEELKMTVLRQGSNAFQVIFPSGAYIKIQNNRRFINVYASAPGTIFAPFGLELPEDEQTQLVETNLGVQRAFGICGNFDGHPENDLLNQEKVDSLFVDTDDLLFGFEYPRDYVPPRGRRSRRQFEREQRQNQIDCDLRFRLPRRRGNGDDVTDVLEENTENTDPEEYEAPENNSTVDNTEFTQEEKEKADKICRDAVTGNELADACQKLGVDIEGIIADCAADVLASDADPDLIASALAALAAECIGGAEGAGEGDQDTAGEVQNMICPNDCSGNGACVEGKCNCNDPFEGADCSQTPDAVPTITTGNEQGTCDQRTAECKTILLSGSNFVDSDGLTCFFSGFGSAPGTFIATETIACPLPQVAQSVDATIFSITVANKVGGTQSNAKLFAIFDSACSTCDDEECDVKDPGTYCDIDGICHAPEQFSPDNKCFKCDPREQGLHFVRDGSVNGCSPSFAKSLHELELPENQQVTGEFDLFDVTNARDLQNQEIPFHFFTASDEFKVNFNTGVLTAREGVQLNAEESPYTFIVKATDNLEGNLVGTTTVKVTVTDTNEPPTNLRLEPSTVRENATVGSVVGVLKADDPERDTLTFTLVDSQGAEVTVSDDGLFKLVGAEVQVAASLDFEATKVHTIKARVTDGAFSISETIMIDVTDVNEAPMNVALSVENPTVEENAPAFTIATVTATDEDVNAVLTIELIEDALPENLQGLLEIAQGGVCSTVDDVVTCTAQLMTSATKGINFEAVKTIPATVRVTDEKGLHTTKTFTVTVTDVNDAPSAISFSANSVRENAFRTLVAIETTDEDQQDTDFSYELISATPDNLFVIVQNGAEDVLQLNDDSLGGLDAETVDEYEITIKSTDSRGLSVTATLTLGVDDVNEPPVFDPSSFSLEVREGEEKNFVIETLAADDQDSGANGRVDYSLENADANDFLKINRNGELRVKARFSFADFQANPVMFTNLNVIATDRGDPALTDRARFSVFVRDVQVAPRFNRDEFTAEVAEDASNGDLVRRVVAADLDGDAVTYSIVDEFELGIFSVDETTGRVRVANEAELDHEVLPTIRATVTATDSTGLTDTTTIVVTVTDANDAPTIGSLNSVQISSSQAAGSIVSEVDVDDQDARNQRRHRRLPEFSQITLSIAVTPTEFAEFFGVDQESLSVTLLQTPTEAMAEAQVSILVTAQDGLGLSDSATLTVSVFPGCSPFPCLAGFACDPAQTSPADCTTCRPGFEGETCLVEINECLTDNTCAEGETCVDEVNGVSCIAPTTTTTTTTTSRNRPCNLPCRNGGTCALSQRGTPFCDCIDGFTGQLCQNGGTSIQGVVSVSQVNRRRSTEDEAAALVTSLAHTMNYPGDLISAEHASGNDFDVTIQVRGTDADSLIEVFEESIESGAVDRSMTAVTGVEYEAELEGEPFVFVSDNVGDNAGSSGSSGSSTNVIIPVIAAVALVAILAIAAYVVIARRRADDQELLFKGGYNAEYAPEAVYASGPDNAPASLEWLFKSMSRTEAEEKLKEHHPIPNGTYLVREKPTTFALSLASDGKISHHLIECQHSSCTIDGTPVSASVNSVPALVKHLASNPESLRAPLVVPPQTASSKTPWLKENFTRAQAEEFLRAQSRTNGTFVVRQKDVSCFVVTVFSSIKGEIEHHMCRRTADGFMVNGQLVSPAVTQISELVDALKRDTEKGMSTVLIRAVTELGEPTENEMEAALADDGDGYLRINPDDEDVYLAFDDDFNNEGDIYLAIDDEADTYTVARDYLNRLTWYHPRMTMMQAEEFLREKPEGSFVVYGSPDQILGVKLEDRVRHDRLLSTAGGELQLSISGSEQPWFSELNALLAYYQSPRVDVPYELSMYNIPYGVDEDIYLSMAEETGGDVYMDLDAVPTDIYMDVDEVEQSFMN